MYLSQRREKHEGTQRRRLKGKQSTERGDERIRCSLRERILGEGVEAVGGPEDIVAEETRRRPLLLQCAHLGEKAEVGDINEMGDS